MDFSFSAPTLDTLSKQLSTATPRQRAQFREHLRAHGTPLINATRGTAVFLWEAPDDASVLGRGAMQSAEAVYLWINRVTDRSDFAAGLMRRIPGTPWWGAELTIDPGARHSYGFLSVSPDFCGLAGPPPLGPGGFRLDPFNAHRPVLDFGDGHGASLLAAPSAPSDVDWSQLLADESKGGTVVTDHSWSVDSGRRSTYLYVPPGTPPMASAPTPLIVLLDGEQWFEHAGLPAAFDSAAARGSIGPVAVLGISAAHGMPRLADMCRCTEILEFISEHALPWARILLEQRGHRLPPSGSELLAITGASLGGYIALAAAVQSAAQFGTVLAQSPSLWASPAGGSPRDLATLDGPGWLATRFSSVPARPVDIVMTVGSRESESFPLAQRFYELGASAGWNLTFAPVAGGHDIAWWRGELLELAAQLAPSDRFSSGKPNGTGL